jgi:hypothetical protein
MPLGHRLAPLLEPAPRLVERGRVAMTRPITAWLGSFFSPSARSNPSISLGLCPAMSCQNRTTAVGPSDPAIIATATMVNIPR